MSKRIEAISLEEEIRASREFHSAKTKGRTEQQLSSVLKSIDENTSEDAELFDALPSFEKFTKRTRR